MILPLHDDNPTRTRPFITIALIVGCTLVFLWEIYRGPEAAQRIVYSLGAIPAVLLGHRALPDDLLLVPPLFSVVTSMFLHGGLLHLAGNMLYLWIFGNNVEDAMGHGRFVVFYLICGLAAVLAQALPNPTSTVPMVGASGAISGVLGAYMLLYPHARVLLGLPLGFFIIQLGRYRAVWVLAAWFGMQLVMNVFASNSAEAEGGVAFRAHIGGFVAGLALIPFMKHRNVTLWRRRR